MLLKDTTYPIFCMKTDKISPYSFISANNLMNSDIYKKQSFMAWLMLYMMLIKFTKIPGLLNQTNERLRGIYYG